MSMTLLDKINKAIKELNDYEGYKKDEDSQYFRKLWLGWLFDYRDRYSSLTEDELQNAQTIYTYHSLNYRQMLLETEIAKKK